MNHAPCLELRVVHSSPGRLRVRLPDPGGQVIARLRRLPGVDYAEANPLTDNILILFDARQTSEKTLWAELRAWCTKAPAVEPTLAAPRCTLEAPCGKGSPQTEFGGVATHSRQSNAAGPTVYVTGFRSWLYKTLGWGSVGMAVVGAITPGIPTVPFVVLAGYFFARSSPEAHQWLRRSRWLGPLLRDWEAHRGVRRSVKFTVVGLLGAGLILALLLELSQFAIVSMLTFGLLGVIIVLRLPEVDISQQALQT